jgi:predicted nucleotidyltransferase
MRLQTAIVALASIAAKAKTQGVLTIKHTADTSTTELQDHRGLPDSVRKFLLALSTEPSIEKIVLFGSRAVGDHDATSDVDVAIHAPRLTIPQFGRLRARAAYARTLYWVTLVHFERTPVMLRQRILEQGVILFERTNLRV